MYRFYTKVIRGLLDVDTMFQYILCIGFTPRDMLDSMVYGRFNTSYVSVLHGMLADHQANLKFQYILCIGFTNDHWEARLPVETVSIHPMYRFYMFQPLCLLAYLQVSIHPMYRFYFKLFANT